MFPWRILLIASVVSLSISASFAKRTDEEAFALTQRAQHASDIRAKGDPAFRLMANFKIFGKDGSIAGGTYAEFWKSPEDWRKEIVQGDFRRTIVAVGRRVWTLDDGPSPPDWIDKFDGMLEPLKVDRSQWKHLKFQDSNLLGAALRCFTGAWEGLCFDKASGLLAQKTSSLAMSDIGMDWSCLYRDYRRFDEREVATIYQCGYKKPQIELDVVSLVFSPELDAGLFTPPANAKSSELCVGKPRPPMVIRQVEPTPPRKGHEIVALSTVIGTDGKPHEIRVIRSVDKDYDSAAVEALRQWEFRPASCDGDAKEVRITVELEFEFH